MEITPLCKVAYKYGTDKCPQIKHTYTPYYYNLLKDKRESIKKVLEMGIGYYKTMTEVAVIYDRGLKRYYQKGASLKMWRDFFPNATIYGADIKSEALFEEDRIKTFLCDQNNEVDVANLVKQTGSDIDLFIDDGSHYWKSQAILAKTIMPLLKEDVIYIIEDVAFPLHIKEFLPEYYVSAPRLEYKKIIRKHIPKDRLLLVRRK